jgi:uroporphyrin-III C-methyltransferase/precorrin-2 dehydrogenase/sirohydrochlorin ferrochelatase
LTRRAWRRLRSAEAVFYDGLVPAPIVRIARHARRVSVARRAGPKEIDEAEVLTALIDAASAGRRTVRLKAGDPFVLGRGHDEVAALAASGVPCEVVPGVTSATAAPLLAGIPLTARGLAAGFLVVSGHDTGAFGPALSTLAPHSVTVVVLMGMARRTEIRDVLLATGWVPDTPTAVITDASRPTQCQRISTLRELTTDGTTGPRSPGVIVIGRTVACVPARSEQCAAHRRIHEQ